MVRLSSVCLLSVRLSVTDVLWLSVRSQENFFCSIISLLSVLSTYKICEMYFKGNIFKLGVKCCRVGIKN